MTSPSLAIAPALSMSPPPYGAWLEAYVRGDQLAFTKLVRQTTPLVMAAALRRCSGRHALAEEAAQAVFVDLAKRAPSLRADATLVAWLHQRATRAAADLMKQEYRRTMREQQAVPPGELYSLNEGAVPDSWLDCREQVDAALSRLKLDEQAALLLRCAEGHDFDAVGAGLGCSAEAARKKVSRALEKVRRILTGHRKGISAVVIAHGLAVDQAHAATGAAGAGIDALANHLAGTALAAAGKITVLARAWPWLKALGTGTGAAAAIWVWPIAAASGAFSSKTTAPLTSPVAAVAPAQKGTGFPAVPVQPPIKEGLSVDEIVRGLAAMAEGPRYPDSFIRLEFYRKQLPPDQAGQALTKLKRMVSVSGWHEFLKRGWSEEFFATWAIRDGSAALDFGMSDLNGQDFKDAEGVTTSGLASNTLYECIESMCVVHSERAPGRSVEENARILVIWATAKLATASDAGWTAVQRALISRGRDLASRVVDTGDKDAIRQLFDLVNQHGLKWLDFCVSNVRSRETLATVMELLPRLDSPQVRSELQSSAMGKLAEFYPEEAKRQVEAVADPPQRWALAAQVGAPIFGFKMGGPLIIDEAAKGKADWWLQQSVAGEELESGRVILRTWLEMDPEWAIQWMEGHFSREETIKAFRESLKGAVQLAATFGLDGPAVKPREALQNKFTLLRKLDPDRADQSIVEWLEGEPSFEYSKAVKELLIQ